MSMDAGGLAQMSYSNFPSSNGLGVPSSGFASRGKGAHIKRLSFEPTKAVEAQDNGAPTPRTSRSHLLAGLRTAPKSAASATFPSARPGLEASMHADKENTRQYGAKTATFATQSQNPYAGRPVYSMPEQILSPPEIQIDNGHEQMDPNLYAQLVATNMYLAEQQQRLQQQLLNVQAAAQQFQGLNLHNQMQQQFATPPITPNMGVYQQKSMQPIVTPVPGAQPGLYSVYNPLTGQQSYYLDPQAQSAHFDQYAESFATQSYNHSPPQQPGTPRFQVSPPPSETVPFTRSISPPKKSSSPPQDVSPLPPPSANAFRRGHKKTISSVATGVNVQAAPSNAKISGLPQTPMTGTFGPGAARAGEHPIRQPRGPPSLDELKAKPTTKFEGSKNFAARQRRSAVSNLVRAGAERRRSPGSASAGSMTPVSEHGEMNFSISDNDSVASGKANTFEDLSDSDSVRSGSGALSGRPSLPSRSSAHGAIGSNRPSSRQKDRKSVDSNYTTATVASDEDASVGGSFAAVFKNANKKVDETEPRKAPMLVLSTKSSIY
jgi:hypothetical protein